MNKMQALWTQVPVTVRKVLVFVVGILLIVAAGVTAPIPGPGGLPLLLLGIAVLATEFAWARTIRDNIIRVIEQTSDRFSPLQKIWLLNGALIVAAISVAGWTIYFNR